MEKGLVNKIINLIYEYQENHYAEVPHRIDIGVEIYHWLLLELDSTVTHYYNSDINQITKLMGIPVFINYENKYKLSVR
jgi:hypothetical protein